MSIACLLAKVGLISASLCAAPTPYDFDYIDADGSLMAQASTAVKVSNELLAAAGEPSRLVLRRMGDPVPSEGVIPVYVVTPPGSAATIRAESKRVNELLDKFRLENFEMDPKYSNCTDGDECAELLYRGQNITELVVDAFDGLANAEVAFEAEECRCIVLHARDLVRYQTVFGRPWGAFILGARFAGEPAPDISRVPKIMMEPDGLDLRWILPSILLHEIGHSRAEVPFPAPKGLMEASMTEYLKQLGGGRKAEEARADAYAAAVMKRSCFLSGVSAEAKRACLISVYSTMVMFGLTLWGKTKEALCARYLDPSTNYPNLHLRALMRDALMAENASGINLFTDFLMTRLELARRSGVQEVKRCAAGLAATFLPTHGGAGTTTTGQAP